MLTSTTLNTRRQQRGITLIEVSIGLIIAAIIAAAAFIAFQNNSRRAEVRDNVRQITEVISETKQKIGLPLSYDAMDTQNAISLGIVDESETTAGTAVNSYNGQILFFEGTTAELGVLVWNGVPEDQCGDLVVAALEGSTRVGSSDGTTAALVTPATVVDGRIDLAEVDTICTPAVDGDPVNIAFEFGRR